MKPETNDRRRGQRVQARLQIELQMDPDGPSHASDTINISAHGVYFTSPRYIEPLTKLGLRLLLPEEGGGETAVDCRGIVVRVVPDQPRAGVERYEIACYFTDTSPEFQARLEHYVHNHI
jgi:hypothetical protein